MPSSSYLAQERHPVIGCTTFCKTVSKPSPFEMVGIKRTYVEAVRSAGGVPLLIPVGLSQTEIEALFERIDGLLLPGGGDMDPGIYTEEEPHPTLRAVDRARDELEIFMSRAAVAREKPVLAVCRGLQVFNVALGGTLWQDLGSQNPGVIGHDHVWGNPRNHIQHKVVIQANSKLAAILGDDEVAVNSLHHQGIRRLSQELRATGHSVDGLIEGVEIPGHPFAIGVQWHPEELIHDDQAMLALFSSLVEAAATSHSHVEVADGQLPSPVGHGS